MENKKYKKRKKYFEKIPQPDKEEKKNDKN